ncbi:uncharacterized protein F4812DRAFT_467115 [Daldinia caldariorum]|uniref:uncharacterized protein n=1 Tax=Daldinia caldariorum TaxID=326644 RepID=UPI00200753F3|nr:uncharacterized protein F4812DRAFT_467115 [Daldinia caldariorum]KAI1464531.1 hypothetical protein F4812DRAFT_467115 [Daldinia caldariorum]
MSSFVSLDLLNDGVSDLNRKINDTLQNLVNNVESPESAAGIIHGVIVDDCRDAHAAYLALPNPTLEQITSGAVRTPNPRGWMEYLWDCVGRAAMKVPADHGGQERLIGLLQELQKLPKDPVPEFSDGQMREKVLWNITKDTGYEGFPQWLCDLDQGNFSGPRQLEEDPNAATAYVNFSAFLARLLASGIADTNTLSALRRPSPFATSHQDRILLDLSLHEPYAAAAAQWIIYAGDTLFELSEKRVLVEVGGLRYSRALWQAWGVKFKALAESDQASAEVREFSRQALDKMDQCKKDGINPTKSVIEKFGYLHPEN